MYSLTMRRPGCVANERLRKSSHSSVLKKLLATALSQQSPFSLIARLHVKCEIRSIKMEVAFDRLESSPNCGFRSGLLSRLRRTRNQVVHVDEAHSDVQVLLDSPDKLRSMLRDAITDAKKKLFRHLG